MNFPGIGGYQPTSYATGNKSAQAKKSSEALFANSLSTQKKANVENKSDQTLEASGGLSPNYDIRNCTYDQFWEISKKLLDEGKIPPKEFAIMTFDWDKALQDLKTRFPNRATVSSLYLTPANSDGRRDWIAEFEAQLKQDHLNYTIYQDIVQALRSLDI